MRQQRHIVAIFSLMFALFFTVPAPLFAVEEQETYRITQKGAETIAIAIHHLASSGKQENAFATKLDNLIRHNLDFIGLFSINPTPLNIDGSTETAIRGLSTLSDELYLTGTVTTKNGLVNLEAKVYDVPGLKLLIRKNYSGKEKDLKHISDTFCGDLLERVIGKRSVFGSQIAFVGTASGYKEIYLCDFDGTNIEQLTELKSISLTPALSPDGKYLAFTDFTTRRPGLSIKNLHNDTIVRVPQHGVSVDPAWRNERELATTLSFEGDQEIYLIKSEGTIYRRLTRNFGIDLSPSFSPDGNQMVFVSERNGQPQLFIQNLLTAEVRRLTYSGDYNTQPAWSPKGDKIAFTTYEKNGEINIFVVSTDGLELKQLTEKSGKNESPSWSPDGDMIVFTSDRSGKRKLYVMTAAGSGQRELFEMKGEQMQPFWSQYRK